MTTRLRAIAALTGAIGAMWTLSAGVTIYDAAADFSATMNPAGVWSYGWSPTLGGTFNLNTEVAAFGGGAIQWQGNQPPNADGNPSVFKNVSGSILNISSITMPVGALALHPGSGGQYSIVRFTAPSSGQYLISANFMGLDIYPTSTDVHVLINGASQFDGLVNGYGLPSTAFTPTYSTLSAGGIVDFVVGFNAGVGPDIPSPTFHNDSTGLTAVVTAIPEPTTVLASAWLLLPIGVSLLRRMRRA